MKHAELTYPAGRGFLHDRLDRAMAAAPVENLASLVGRGPVFVLAPHPDDESIGCGGLIAACAAADIPVFVHVLTDGRHSHPGSRTWSPERIAVQRELEARRAVTCLGLPESALVFERAVDGTLLFDWACARRIGERIAAAVRGYPAPVVLAPWRGDPHPDHIAAAAIADMIENECRDVSGLRYLIWAHDHAEQHSVRIDAASMRRLAIDEWLHQKRRAIFAHQSQTGGLIEDAAAGRLLVPDLAKFLGPFEAYLTSTA